MLFGDDVDVDVVSKNCEQGHPNRGISLFSRQQWALFPMMYFRGSWPLMGAVIRSDRSAIPSHGSERGNKTATAKRVVEWEGLDN
jgi:hypothetical protein